VTVLAALLILLILAAGYASWRYAWWLPAVSYRHPRILMYHMISPAPAGAKFRGLRVTPDQFERQLRYLRDHGWRFVTMAELMAQTPDLPEKTVALTFDDGYEDNYTQAFPLLKKYQAKATLYLVVDRHHRDWSTYKKAHHDSGELAREPKLSDWQVTEMLASGLVELGAHTLTHANLTAADEASRWREIAESRSVLESRFVTAVESFAYPFGLYGPSDVAAVHKAGYTSAVTVLEGIEARAADRPFELRRVKISGKDSFFAFRLRMRRGRRGVRS
jgi:peptidoglycan/xylan/chitin deacetylase (PgdA/CDA1 family)